MLQTERWALLHNTTSSPTSHAAATLVLLMVRVADIEANAAAKGTVLQCSQWAPLMLANAAMWPTLLCGCKSCCCCGCHCNC